jgi:hypothetical protein
MWQFPWKYRESYAIAAGLLLCGVCLEFASPVSLPPATYPYNILTGASIVVICAFITFRNKKNIVVRWLTGIPASVSAISLFSVLSLLIGFIPQREATTFGKEFGFTHITTSWQYLFSLMYLMFVLCCVALKHTYPFRPNNTGFILNHWGLLLVLLGMSMGTGDKRKVTLNLYENQTQWIGYNEQNEEVEMPVAFKLQSFKIEDYKPSLLFVDNETGNVLPERKNSHQVMIDSGSFVHKDNWDIKVERYLPDAAWFNDQFLVFNSKGSVPAAYIKATDNTGQTTEGWISCGNYLTSPVLLRLDRNISVAMELPRPKSYQSSLIIYTPGGDRVAKTIEVNRPARIEGWKVYQTGFDEKMGKWSDLSIVQAVKDPWLPVIYSGLYMLIAGAGFMIWKGKSLKNLNQSI